MIELDADIYDALVKTAEQFGGVGAGKANEGNAPLCPLGCIAYADTGDPKRMWEPEQYGYGQQDKPPRSEMVTRAIAQGLEYQEVDNVIHGSSRIPIQTLFSLLHITRKEVK